MRGNDDKTLLFLVLAISQIGDVVISIIASLNYLSAAPTKWSNTLKKISRLLSTYCLIVFDHFEGLALKGLLKR